MNRRKIASKFCAMMLLVVMCVSFAACGAKSQAEDWYYATDVGISVTSAYDMEIVIPYSLDYKLELVDDSHYVLTTCSQSKLMNGTETDWGYLSRNTQVSYGTYTVDSEDETEKSISLAKPEQIQMTSASGENEYAYCDTASFPADGYDYKEHEQAAVVSYTSAEDFLGDFAKAYSAVLNLENHTLTMEAAE